MELLYTKKIYYKKFSHRLEIKCRRNNHHKSKPSPEVIEWLLANKFNKDEYRGLDIYQTGYSFHKDFAVFFKDVKIFNYLKEALGEEAFRSYERPMDDQHVEMLEKEKVVTRKTLFHNKYRIAVRTKAGRDARGYIDTKTTYAMRDWCRDQFDPKDWHYSGYHNLSFFFKNPKDAVLFKLSHSGNMSTERVVLFSEMEEARKGAESEPVGDQASETVKGE